MSNVLIKNLSYILLIITVSSCAVKKEKPVAKDTGGQYKMLTSTTITPKNNLQITRYTKDKIWDLLHTQLDLDVDIMHHTLYGNAMIWVKPHFYQQDSLVLDAKYFSIESVHLIDNKMNIDTFQLNSTLQPLTYEKTPLKLKIKLPNTLDRDDTVAVMIKYVVQPDSVQVSGSNAIRDSRGIYFLTPDQWHVTRPFQTWTQGEPESASAWFPTLDAPNQKSTHVMRLVYDDSLKSLANGEKISSTISLGKNTDIWKMKQKISPYLFMITIGQYKVISDRNAMGIPVQYYVDPNYNRLAKEIFRYTPEMIEYFSTVTGVPYPWNKYSQIIIHDFVSGAMENTTATTHGDFVEKNGHEIIDASNDPIVSHELFHHWFGDLVTFEDFSQITLSESFATFGEILWYEHQYGKHAGEKKRYNDLRRYLTGRQMDDPPLVRYHYIKQGDVFDLVSYPKGACILYMLRDYIGKPAFDESMKKYLTTFRFENAEVSNWQQTIEMVTGKDMKAFFDQWYFRGGVPMITVNITFDDINQQAVMTVKQTADSDGIYKFETALWNYSNHGFAPSKQSLSIKDSITVVKFPYENGHRPIPVFDAHHTLVADISVQADSLYWNELLTASDHYVDIVLATKSLAKASNNFQLQNKYYDFLLSKNIDIQTLVAPYMNSAQLTIDQINVLKSKLKNPNENPEVRKSLIKSLSKNIETAEYMSMLQDTSYQVSGTCLYILDSIDHQSAVTKAYELYPTSGGMMKSTILYVLSKEKTINALDIYHEEMSNTYGKNSVAPSNYLTTFLENQVDTNMIKKGVDILTSKAVHDDLLSTKEYVTEKIYSLYSYYSQNNMISMAKYCQASIQNEIFQSKWPNKDRLEDLIMAYDWIVKLGD